MKTNKLIAFRSLLFALTCAVLAACGPDDGTTSPAPPASLTTVQSESIDGHVTLAWSESSGATSYQIKRSTSSGGPYVPFAISTSTSVTDISPADGTTYHYVVSAANSTGVSENSMQVSAVSQAATAPPYAPGDPTATAGDAQISLTWGASSGATSYKVKRSDDSGGTYHVVGIPTSASFIDTGLTNGRVYYYVVTAVNSAGESGNSGLAGGTPQGSTTAPQAPSNVTATAGNAQVSLSWSTNAGTTSHNVKRSTSNGGPYTQVAARTGTTYTDSSLPNGTPQYYVITATNSSGESGNSAQVNATPAAALTPPPSGPPASGPPPPPNNLIATTGNAQITLAWSAASGATSYNVKRSDDSGGTYRVVASPTTTSYVDNGLTNGRVYYYVVTSVNSAGESGNSGLVGGIPQGSVSAPSAPANVAATAGNAQVSLSWSASGGATSYNVKRSTSNGGPYTQVAARTGTTYTDSSLPNGTTQYYVLTATNSSGESGNSAQVNATPAAAPAPPPPGPPASAPPPPPSNLIANAGNAQITLNWSVASGATSYNVKRSDDSGGTYRVVASPTTTSYVDNGLTNGRVYYYVVTSANSAGESGNSGLVGGTPQGSATAPQAPSNVMATAGNTQVGLSWVASNGATSYKVKRSMTSGGPYAQIAAPTSTSYTDSSLSNGTTYYYVVVGVNAAGDSSNSAQVSATPVAPAVAPSAPANLTATAGNGQVSLNWTASSGATSYNVKRSSSSSGPFAQIATSAATSYTNTSLANGTTYYYVVTAVNSAGESANSATVGGTPTGSAVVSYSTAFDANESPISEGGRWEHNNPWFTKVVTNGGIAYGTSPNPARQDMYEDSYAILKGMNFPANQYASAHIYKGPNTGGYMEVELLLRASDTGNSTQAYECYLHQDGFYVTVTRWKGTPLNAPPSIAYFDELARRQFIATPRDGDLFEAQIVGNIITVKLAGATVLTVDVSQYDGQVFATGQPGISFDVGNSGGEGPNSSFGLRDFYASGL